jgi:hypothetical protein
MEAKIIKLLPTEAQAEINIPGISTSAHLFLCFNFISFNRKYNYIMQFGFFCPANPVASFIGQT